MKILITGGAGFIGSNLTKKLLEKGYYITILDNLSPQIHGDGTNATLFDEIKDKVHFFKGDIRDANQLNRALKGQDVVVHYAAETGTGQSMYEIEKYSDVNINGTALLLDLISNHHKKTVKKVIVASSRSIYGEGKYLDADGRFFYPNERSNDELKNGGFEIKCPKSGGNAEAVATDENSKLHPSSIYGLTKLTQEQMCLIAGKSLSIPTIALRYQNVYGPGQSLKNPYTGILSIFSNIIMSNGEINIFEDGKETRDFVYIDDVVEATILAIENNDELYEVFNVGSGIQTSVNKVVELLMAEYAEHSASIKISGNYRLGDIRHNFADLTKIRSLLGFEPKWHFESGIKEFCSWVKESNSESNIESYHSSLEEMRSKGLLK